jgi:hypothetical protein
MTSWNGGCGEIGTDEFGNEVFNQPDGCSLGGYAVSDSATPPAPAQFLARPGETVVQVYVRAIRDGDVYEVPMYARVGGR